MKEFKLLKFLDKYKGIYEKFGVDYEKMRLILKIKLTMDERRVPTIMKNNSKKKEEKNVFVKSLLFYAFMGLFMGIITFISTNKMYVYTMTFAIFMFIVLSVFIADFSSVLLDIRDKNLISIRGVDNRTINAAKITHICYYVFSISLAIGWLAIIGSFKSGILTGIVFLLELIIVSTFMIVITALLYLLVLRFFNGEIVKDIINYVQIILSITMTIGYQFVGQVFELSDLKIVYQGKIWHLLFPPMWFSAPIYIIEGGNLSKIITLLIICACIVPLVSVIIYFKNSNKFELYLSKLNNNDSNEKERKKGIFFKLGKQFCKSSAEKACYSLAYSTIKREREFKLKVYPTLGFIIIFPLFSMLLLSHFSIYFFVVMVPSIMLTLQYSEFYKAAWIYKTTPLINEGDIFKGVYKAFLFTMIMPIYVFESIIFILFLKINAVPHLIIALLFMSALIPITHKASKFSFPFSDEFRAANGGAGLFILFLSLFLVGAGAVLHAVLGMKMVLLIVYGIGLIGLNYTLWKNLKPKVS